MIQYPGSKKIYEKKAVNGVTSRRGMSLEEDLNTTNAYYLMKQRAVVHKKPTPIQIVNVDYPSRNKAKITEAYFRQASTTDFQGVWQGFALDFEAKETKNKTLFPLALLHQHQIDHIRSVHAQQAIAFLIIRFSTLALTYIVMAADLLAYIDTYSPRSLPLSWIERVGRVVNSSYQVPCDYLSTINALVDEKESL